MKKTFVLAPTRFSKVYFIYLQNDATYFQRQIIDGSILMHQHLKIETAQNDIVCELIWVVKSFVFFHFLNLFIVSDLNVVQIWSILICFRLHESKFYTWIRKVIAWPFKFIFALFNQCFFKCIVIYLSLPVICNLNLAFYNSHWVKLR